MDPNERLAALLRAELEGEALPLLMFWGHTPGHDAHLGPWVLSQWWPSRFVVDGAAYRHAEGFMMAEKARLFGDAAALERILAAKEPALAKQLGRTVRGFDVARWGKERYEIVVRANVAKFSQSPELGDYLQSTAPRVLVETSPRDRIWGIGLAAESAAALRPSRWRGRNLLGFALTEVRERLAGTPEAVVGGDGGAASRTRRPQRPR